MDIRARSVELTISLSALRHNFLQAKRAANGQKIMAVVKADAYGHGAVEVAKALSTSDNRTGTNAVADAFAVVCLAEAIVLREAGIQQPILILQGPTSVEECRAAAQLHLWPVIHDLSQLKMFAATAQAKTLQAWLKVDTGMGRLGFSLNDAANILASPGHINWFGVLSHLASADDLDNQFTLSQADKFNTAFNSVGLQRSLANSAGVIGWPACASDWARPGIMLYGCNPIHSDEAFSTPVSTGIEHSKKTDVFVKTEAIVGKPELKSVMQACAPLISRKRLEAGATVGYAQTYCAERAMDIALVAAGYGDGLPRVLDGTASVLVGGHVCPVIGRVSMDSIAIDLSNAADAKVGDQAQLWGPGHEIGIWARASGTIEYETMTSIRGHRCYIDE